MATKKENKSNGTRKSSPRAKKAEPKEETAPASVSPPPSVEQIQARAYEIFRSGVNPKDPVADWVQAEKELRAEPGA
jgi:hypothetical protein